MINVWIKTKLLPVYWPEKWKDTQMWVIALHRNYNLDHSKFNRSWYDISSKYLAFGGGGYGTKLIFPFQFKLILLTIIFLNFHNGSLWEKMDVSYPYFLKYLMKLLIWRLNFCCISKSECQLGKHFYEW